MLPVFIWAPIVITFYSLWIISALKNAATEETEVHYEVDKDGELIEITETKLTA